jgi:translation initiation factor 4E
MHPLSSAWDWHFQTQGSTSESYSSSCTCVGTFETIEDFWRYRNNIPRVAEALCKERALKVGDGIVNGMSVFRHGVQPLWEDPRNADGKIFEYKGCLPADEIDVVFMDVLLSALCGHASERFNGVRIVYKSGRKSFYKVELWFASGCSEEDLSGISSRSKFVGR